MVDSAFVAHEAARKGRVDVLRLLVKQCGSEALAHRAALNGHVNVLRFLAEQCGSEVLTATRADGATPARNAALRCDKLSLEGLLCQLSLLGGY